MIVYAAATLLACFAAWMAGRDRARRNVWIVASALPLTLVAAARWGLGTDIDFTYLPVFTSLEWARGGGGEELAEKLFRPLIDGLVRRPLLHAPIEEARHWFSICGTMEPGYRVLQEAVVFFGGSFRWVVVATSLLAGGLVFTAIWRQSRAPVLAVYFYVATSNYFLSLNIVRQYIAIGFVLVALAYVLDRRPWRFLALVAAGAFFHKTALLALPCWGLARIYARPYWGGAAILAALAASFAAEPVLRAALPLVGAGGYVRYFDMRFAKDGFEWIFFLLNICFIVAGAWYYERAQKGNPLFRCWYWMTVMGTVALSFSGTVPLMKRNNFYFAAPQFLMLPEMLLAEENPRLRRWFTVLAVVAFAAETFVAVVLLNKNEPLPYRILP